MELYAQSYAQIVATKNIILDKTLLKKYRRNKNFLWKTKEEGVYNKMCQDILKWIFQFETKGNKTGIWQHEVWNSLVYVNIYICIILFYDNGVK